MPFSAISFVYHHIFYPCFSAGGGMIDSDMDIFSQGSKTPSYSYGSVRLKWNFDPAKSYVDKLST